MGATPSIYPDQILSNVSVEFTQPGLAAQKFLPRVPVPTISGRIPKAGFERFHRYNTAYFPGGEAREMIRSNIILDAYLCAPHYIKKLVSDTERKASNLPGFEVDVTTTNEVTEIIWLDLEFAAFNLITSGVTGATLAGPNQWSDYVNSDPIAAIEAQKPTILKGATREASKLGLGYDTFIALKSHPKILDRIKYTQRGVITPDILAGLFDVGEVVILSALYDASANAAQGKFGSVNAATSPLDFVWSKIALLAFVPDTPAVRTPALGYSYWFSDTVPGGGPAVYRYRWEIREGEFIECRSFWDVRLVRAQAAYLWQSAIA